MTGVPFRPTSSKVREALFDILGARLKDSSFLDLYAGTGAVGLEALSRGARRAVFVDSDTGALRHLAERVVEGGWQGAAVIVPRAAAAAVALLMRRGESFTIAFLDPPYDPGPAPDMLRRLGELLQPGGILVAEHSTRRPLTPPPDGPLRAGRIYRYGDTTLTVLHRDSEVDLS